MANIKSQIKRNRQNDKKRLRNRVYRGEARIAVKTARTSIEEGVPDSKEAVLKAISVLDKAAEQGVIHKNNAARRKSRLVKALAKMEPGKIVAAPVMVEPVVEAEPIKKKTTKKPAAKKVEETKAEPKKKATPAKKPAAKKAETKKPEPKKTTTRKKTAATKES